MNQQTMNQQLREDLVRLPRGSYSQNILRAIYNMQRRSDLARDPRTPRSASLGESIRFVRKDDSTFEATFDRSYFA